MQHCVHHISEWRKNIEAQSFVSLIITWDTTKRALVYANKIEIPNFRGVCGIVGYFVYFISWMRFNRHLAEMKWDLAEMKLCGWVWKLAPMDTNENDRPEPIKVPLAKLSIWHFDKYSAWFVEIEWHNHFSKVFWFFSLLSKPPI